MNIIKLYYHGGSKNHGCEAIVRATNKILNLPLSIYSTCPNEEFDYGLNNIVKVHHDCDITFSKKTLKYFKAALCIKLFNSTLLYSKYLKVNMLNDAKDNDVWMSIGGDNYCYAGIEKLADLNKLIHQKGAKTVLWGCSIEPRVINNKVIKDLKRYDLITTRESLTYNALIEVGIRDNVVICPDPAFQLDLIELPLPVAFDKDNTIGINVSPLIIDWEENSGQTMDNYIALIQHIIYTTDCQIALIPHVVKEDCDDRIPLNTLYQKFKETGRVVMISDHNCMELKGYIYRCRMFIGARTHATIAAYSTCVPTLVVGYSVKAKGIAKDIFGTYDNYVIPVQSLKNKDDLINAFEWMKTNEADIRNHLKKIMPEYCAKAIKAEEEIRRLVR
jgi:colanic acid/amylovoran biosynthesis protein